MGNKSKQRRESNVPYHRQLTPIDLEALRLSKGETTVKGVCDVAKTLAKWLPILGCFICIYLSVKCFVTGATGIVDKLTGVLEKLFIRDIVYWILIIVLAGGNALRRWRNRRLTKLVGDQRHELEKGEPANTRSGLDPHGEAAEDKE